MNPFLYKDLSYSVEKDLTPISAMAESGFVLVVNPKVPAHSLQELVQLGQRIRDDSTMWSKVLRDAGMGPLN